MPQQLAEFEWWVAPNGYRWREGVYLKDLPMPPGAVDTGDLTPSDPVLALDLGAYVERQEHGRWVVPDSGLFRTFADLDGTPEAVLAFANRYGELGLHDATFDPKDPWHAWAEAGRWSGSLEVPEQDPIERTDETLPGWRVEIAALRMCIDLHDALESADPEHTLRWHFSRLGTDIAEAIVFEYASVKDEKVRPSSRWSTRVRFYDSGAYRKDPDDPHAHHSYEVHVDHLGVWTFAYYLSGMHEHEAGDSLLDYARVMLSAIVNAHLTERIDTMLLPDRSTDRPVLFTMPRSLIGALWLQLAQAIDGKKQFKCCETCRNWFELAPDKARSDKLYCSQACRSAAYRRRERTRRAAT